MQLKDVGVRIQLGHLPGEVCRLPKAGPAFFIVLDINGVHEVSVDFCGCRSVPDRQQLLRAQFWPATPLHPHTAATFRLLNMFNRLNVQAKTNAHDFWAVLEQLTDGSSVRKVAVRSFRTFLSSLSINLIIDRIGSMRSVLWHASSVISSFVNVEDSAINRMV